MSTETKTFRMATDAKVIAQIYASPKDVWKDAGLPLENEKGQAHRMNTCPPGHKKALTDYQAKFPGSEWLDKTAAREKGYKWSNAEGQQSGKHLVPVVVRCDDSNSDPHAWKH